MMKSKQRKNQVKENGEWGLEFGADENFAFIAGFTENGVPFGINHEESEIEKKDIVTEDKQDKDLPF